MTITKVSKKAFAIVARCGQTKLPYGISVDPMGGQRYKLVWCFKMNEGQATREGMDENKVHGQLGLDTNFNGCPYCGAMGIYQCGKCGQFVCWDREVKHVTCPHCGAECDLVKGKEFDLSGGGY